MTTKTESKFTPGPWDYIEARTLLHVETRHDNPAGAGIHICSVPKTREANAMLLTAAPALYEACQQAAQSIQLAFGASAEQMATLPCGSSQDGFLVESWKQLQAALSLAEGKGKQV